MKRILRPLLSLLVPLTKIKDHCGQQVGLVGQKAISFNFGINLQRSQLLNNRLLLPLRPKQANLVKSSRRLQILHQLHPRPALQQVPHHHVVVTRSICKEFEIHELLLGIIRLNWAHLVHHHILGGVASQIHAQVTSVELIGAYF